MKKEGKGNDSVPEDDPEKYKHAVYVLTMKLFADMERKRQQLDARDQQERRRKREHEIEDEEQEKAEREYQKSFEESRQNRVTSWQDFQSGKKKKAKKQKKNQSFNPPKMKPETR